MKRSGYLYRRFTMEIVMNKWISCRLLLCLAWSFVTPLFAESLGVETLQLLRQKVSDEQRKKDQEKMPDVHYEGMEALQDIGRLPAKELPCFVINEFKLKEPKPDQFQWALAAINPVDDPAVGKCLGTAGVNLVLKRVQNSMIARGFVTTRVLVEPQQLSSGTLTMTLIPGLVRKIYFVEEANGRGRIWNALPLQSGELLNLRNIEQGLENFKRLPTVEAEIKIAPAEGIDTKPGESDVLINWQQSFPLRLNLVIDDAGSKATGQYQGNAALAYDHLLTLNDVLEVNANQNLGSGDAAPSGTNGYNVHYSLPVDYSLFSISGGENDYYQTVAGAAQDYVYSGHSHTAEAKLARLLYRDNVRKFSAIVGAWLRTSSNFIDDTEVEVQRRRMAGWEAGINHREFIGSSTLDATVTYRRGTGAFDSLPAPEESFGEGDSHPGIISADVQYAAIFNIARQAINYAGEVRAQWNRTSLVPQDRFAIGGRYTVRGFDGENVLAAERGWLMRNDFGYGLGDHELYIGFDFGRVSGPSSDTLLGKRLAGEVFGLRGDYRHFGYDIFIGQPVTRPAGFQLANQAAGFSIRYAF